MLVVSFLSFLLFLSVSVSQISATGNNNKAALKDQLERSITHVSQILADVENKIGRERRILSEIDNELNLDRESGQIEVDYGINIFWNSSTTQAAPGKFGNYTYTIRTTPSLFPTPPSRSTYGTPPANWHLTSQAGGGTTDTLYIEDLKKNMETKQYGYFSAFVDEFTELMFTKNLTDGYNVAAMLSFLLKKNVNEGRFMSMGDNLIGVITLLLSWFDLLTPIRVQQQAGVLHHVIQVKDKALSSDMNNLINYYDSMFTKEEGQALFEALELCFIYPEENISLATLGNKIFQTVFSPYFKSEGTRKQKRLIQYILMAVHDVDPNFRSITEAYSAKGYSLGSLFPGRRSINYEKVVKHFLRKHPKLFKKIKRQYKHDKKKKHHHFSHERHHNYRKTRSRDHRHGHRYKHEKITQRARSDKKNKLTNEDMEKDSSKSDAYYGENLEVYPQENTHNIQLTHTSNKQLNKLKQRRQMPLETKPRPVRTAALSVAELPEVDLGDPQYLKQLAIRFLRKRQQNQNFNRNRRLNIPSSEEDICDHSQFLKDSVENDKIHKIREVSSYSDEEDHLKMNLYDALRHGNKTFVSFRKSNGDVINKHMLQDLSSEADDEWILKNNIYKVFGREK